MSCTNNTVVLSGRVTPTSFMNLDQKLNWVHAELRCTKLNSDQLIPFSWTVVVITWTTLTGQPRSAHRPTTLEPLWCNANYAELGSNSNLTRVQSWTMLVQRALSGWMLFMLWCE